MYGSTMFATFDRGKGPIKLEFGPVKDEVESTRLFTEWINDNRVRQYLGISYPVCQSGEAEYFRKIPENQTVVSWLVWADGTLIGSIGLHAISQSHGSAELGILFGNKTFWGQGIAPVAEALVLEYAFRSIIPGGLHKVQAKVLEGNNRSLSPIEKHLRFRKIGTLKDEFWKNGRWHDAWFGEMLQCEWKEQKESVFKEIGVSTYDTFPGIEPEDDIRTRQ